MFREFIVECHNDWMCSLFCSLFFYDRLLDVINMCDFILFFFLFRAASSSVTLWWPSHLQWIYEIEALKVLDLKFWAQNIGTDILATGKWFHYFVGINGWLGIVIESQKNCIWHDGLVLNAGFTWILEQYCSLMWTFNS